MGLFPTVGLFSQEISSRLQKHFKLKQLVKFPTRGNATLDLFLTNMGDHFATPEPYPRFGLSDHCTVFVRPKERIPNQKTRKSILIRDKRDSNKARLGRYFGNIDWSCVTHQPSCEEKLKAAGMFCRLQVAGCRLKFHYNWKTAETKNN